jgi:hypothetical protein
LFLEISAVQQHPLASHDLPWFTPGADGSDPLFTVATISVVAAVALLGVLFFTLHSLPERLGHKKLQFEIVAVLGLLSLFTHVHAFWVAGLLLALIDLPDFLTPLKRIAAANEKRAGIEAPEAATAVAGSHDPIHATPDQLREAKEELMEARKRTEAKQQGGAASKNETIKAGA